MTQTSEVQTSEAPSLETLLDAAFDLAAAIGTRMDAVKNNDGPVQPAEWKELGIAAGAVSLAAEQIYQMIRRHREALAAADQPIPYTPAPVASCGHPADEDGECSCASWPERAPLESL